MQACQITFIRAIQDLFDHFGSKNIKPLDARATIWKNGRMELLKHGGSTRSVSMRLVNPIIQVSKLPQLGSTKPKHHCYAKGPEILTDVGDDDGCGEAIVTSMSPNIEGAPKLRKQIWQRA